MTGWVTRGDRQGRKEESKPKQKFVRLKRFRTKLVSVSGDSQQDVPTVLLTVSRTVGTVSQHHLQMEEGQSSRWRHRFVFNAAFKIRTQ